MIDVLSLQSASGEAIRRKAVLLTIASGAFTVFLLVGCRCTTVVTDQADTSRDRQAFIRAAYGGDTDKMKRLLAKGTDINAKYGDGGERFMPVAYLSKRTALHAAVHGCQEKAVQLLVEKGASLDPQADQGQTPLQMAIYSALRCQLRVEAYTDGAQWFGIQGKLIDEEWLKERTRSTDRMFAYLRISVLLIDAGADINTKERGDITPLHRAASSPKILAKLLQRGADPNAQDANGCTPLHWCTTNPDIQVSVLANRLASVSLLLDAGADPGIRDSEGRTAYDRLPPLLRPMCESVLKLRAATSRAVRAGPR